MKRLLAVWVGLGISILWAMFAPRLFAAENDVVSQPGLFVPITPCRTVDTRFGSGFGGTPEYGPPHIAPGTSRTFYFVGICGVPSHGVLAISANWTVDNLDTAAAYVQYPRGVGKWGELRVYPSDAIEPLVSMLNWTELTTVIANAGVVPLSSTGQITAAVDGFGSYGADLIVDVNGYYVAGALKGDAGPPGPPGPPGPQGPPGTSAGGFPQLCSQIRQGTESEPQQHSIDVPPCRSGYVLIVWNGTSWVQKP